MQSDTITDGWLWLAAAAMLLVLVAAVAAYYLFRPKRKPENEIEEEHGTGEWIPTGRVDLTDPQSIGSFVLHAEDTRALQSSGGVEHRQIRWRKATLDKAKRVVMAYHAQRHLTTKANFL